MAITKGRSQVHIYFATRDWSDVWIGQQPIVNEITKSGEFVLYVDFFISIFGGIKVPKYRPKIIQWFKGKRCGLEKVNKNLFVFTPPLGFHIGSHWPFLFKINYRLLEKSIKKIMKYLGIKKPVIWFDNVFAGYLMGRLGERISIYHVLDEPKEFPGDLLFVVSEQLLKSKKKLNPSTYLIRNGVDIGRFLEVQEDNNINKLFEGMKRPILGFVGAIASWVDLDLLRYVAEKFPNSNLVLVGIEVYGNPAEVNALRNMKNVLFFGKKEQSEIPHYIKNFDICMIPFKKNKLTENADPRKLYEYLAAGKIVVATDISSYFRELNQYIYLARDKHEFVEAIRKALCENFQDKIDKRIQFARSCSWQNRWYTMRDIISNYISTKN